MIAEARRQPGWKVLRSMPFFGPVRVALLLAIMATPFRFRTNRQLWPYIGLAVVTRSSADQEFVDGKLRRRRAHRSPVGSIAITTPRSRTCSRGRRMRPRPSPAH